MCFPPAILAIAASAIGTGLQYAGNKQAESAKLDTFNAERSRQQAFSAEQTAKFQDSLDRTKTLFDPNAEKAAVDAREAPLTAAIAPTPTSASYLPGSSSAPSIVATAQDKASANSTAASTQLAHLIATLGGAGDQKQGVDTQIGRNSGAIDQVSGFSRGSASLLKNEMKAASQKGSFLRGLGGFVQQAGSAVAGRGDAPTNILPKGIFVKPFGSGVGAMQDAPQAFSGVY